MTGCFADLGGGNFCLTTFDKENIHIYVFMIRRSPCENGEDLNLEVLQYKLHKYRYEDFSGKGCQSFKFSGCFAPLGNDRIKEKVKAEAALHCRSFSYWGYNEDTDVPGVQLSQYTDVDDTDSDYYSESDYDYSDYNA
ncbi:hypothetical protein POM88_053353 [Heracleum sosnowskyi]|uniref:Uncharacterized protein n=1 Tax=Heracleum sosnowskyi TaxID=360622 RepID=A0AAD8LY33_9APIA|nr:hypothetical protein POM88_053353 [Heracleum sosnowskyi]